LGVFVVDAAIWGDSIGYVNTSNRLDGEELTIWNDVSHIEFWGSRIWRFWEILKYSADYAILIVKFLHSASASRLLP
jgi:hypothetical protein